MGLWASPPDFKGLEICGRLPPPPPPQAQTYLGKYSHLSFTHEGCWHLGNPRLITESLIQLHILYGPRSFVSCPQIWLLKTRNLHIPPGLHWFQCWPTNFGFILSYSFPLLFCQPSNAFLNI